jgi:hypothetical protein
VLSGVTPRILKIGDQRLARESGRQPKKVREFRHRETG